MAWNSARLNTALSLFLLSILVINLLRMIKGYRGLYIRITKARAVKGASFFHRLAPRVLGMISENMRIRRVSTAEVTERYSLPHIFCAWAPTPAAPMVWANVFR